MEVDIKIRGYLERAYKIICPESNNNVYECDYDVFKMCVGLIPVLQLEEINTKKKRAKKTVEYSEDAKELILLLNEKSGKKFELVDTNLGFAEGALKDYTLQRLKTMVVSKCREWKGTEQEKYLRPETLFKTKVSQYVD